MNKTRRKSCTSKPPRISRKRRKSLRGGLNSAAKQIINEVKKIEKLLITSSKKNKEKSSPSELQDIVIEFIHKKIKTAINKLDNLGRSGKKSCRKTFSMKKNINCEITKDKYYKIAIKLLDFIKFNIVPMLDDVNILQDDRYQIILKKLEKKINRAKKLKRFFEYTEDDLIAYMKIYAKDELKEFQKLNKTIEVQNVIDVPVSRYIGLFQNKLRMYNCINNYPDYYLESIKGFDRLILDVEELDPDESILPSITYDDEFPIKKFIKEKGFDGKDGRDRNGYINKNKESYLEVLQYLKEENADKDLINKINSVINEIQKHDK